MKWFLDVLRGMVIGLANVIPGVSGGTMMVSMGIYDKLIWSINNLFKKFKECVKILLPYGIGMVIAILAGAIGLKIAFREFPLPTNALFIGLILGSLPFILKELKGEKIGWQGILIFVLFFALVVVLKAIEAENSTEIRLSVLEVLKLFVLGTIASATMVIPGVSGSMMLKTLGYYEPIVTGALPNLLKGLTGGGGEMILHNIGILLPFGLGIVFGIFAIAKLIEFLLKHWKGRTYCAILGMVAASPVVILMGTSIYEGFNVWICLASIVALAVGVLIALKLGGDPEPAGNEAA
ncbi:MAG: DUF368 domain-containing protein [Clostridia bacterium]|nr:DUF368 domain-containing protein [Clostridia bacterium]